MSIPNPNPNIADGMKCDNKTYSSNKIESLITAATELPIPEAGDAGKVLTVNGDADGYELDSIPVELPTPGSSDAGKVLTVNSNADGYELDSIPSEVPTPAAGDAGKVITVNSGSDAYELVTPVDAQELIDDVDTDTCTTGADLTLSVNTVDINNKIATVTVCTDSNDNTAELARWGNYVIAVSPVKPAHDVKELIKVRLGTTDWFDVQATISASTGNITLNDIYGVTTGAITGFNLTATFIIGG